MEMMELSAGEILALEEKYKDRVGFRSGRAEIVGFAGRGINQKNYAKALCDCGNEFVSMYSQICSGRCNSCGCLSKEANSKRLFKDLTGQTINGIYIEKYLGPDHNGSSVWLCKCFCGKYFQTITSCLTTGNTKSCGCIVAKNLSELRSANLVGQRFGRLVVLREYGRDKRGIIWECLCDCGTIVYVHTRDLNIGKTKSCGCLRRDINREMHMADIAGIHCGYLDVIRSVGIQKRKQIWECRCKCGRICYASTQDLLSGNVISCGCIRSVGENLICEYLDRKNIKYVREKTFIGCKDLGSLKFDFWLQDYGVCIEYDGIQHYDQVHYFKYAKGDVQRRDAIKTKYCEENDIILLRIPYWEKDNIESILTDWLFLNEETD